MPLAEAPSSLLNQLQEAVGDRFTILRSLGEGGMGTVFLARESSRLGRQVAIKVLALRYAANPEFEERFVREARTIGSLRHQYVVNINDFAQRGGLSYFVMPFISGRSLASVIRDASPLPIGAIQAWLAQTASALEYAHGRGVVHRDVKPSNILLDADGNVVLTDFGIAQTDLDAAQGQGSEDLTQLGMVVGSPRYLSPERWDAQRATPESDQYALGVVGYEMLTGKPPFSGSPMAMLDAHRGTVLPSPNVVRSDCPQDLSDLVDRMLAKRPEDRLPSMHAVLQALGPRCLVAAGEIRQALASSAPEDRAPSSIQVFGPEVPLVAGDARPLRSDVWDATGVFLPSAELEWSSSDPTVAVVTPEGVVQALRPGAVEITVAAGGHEDTVAIVIEPPRVSRIQLTPATRTLLKGGSFEFEATCVDSAGQAIAAKGIDWVSEAPEVASVSADGVVTGLSAGVVAIEASVDDATVRAVVRVVASEVVGVDVRPIELALTAGEQHEITATIRRYDGGFVEDALLEWATDDAAVAEVSSDGRVRALNPGATAVRARYEGLEGVALVTVTPEAVASVRVSAPEAVLTAGASVKLGVEVLGVSGEPLGARVITFGSDEPGIALVDRQGVVHARESGTAVVWALCEGVRGQVEIAVQGRGTASLGTGVPLPGGSWPSGSLAPPVEPERSGLAAAPDVSGTGTYSGPLANPPKREARGPSLPSRRIMAVAGAVVLFGGMWLATSVWPPSEPPDSVPARLEWVTPLQDIRVGEAVELTAAVFDQIGDTLPGRAAEVEWTTETSETVRIDGIRAVALAAGPALIVGRLGEMELEGQFVVDAAPIGTITVSAITSGPDPDTDGYSIVLDGEEIGGEGLNPNGSLDSISVAEGPHSVALSNVADNCTPPPSQFVEVAGGTNKSLQFGIRCSARPRPASDGPNGDQPPANRQPPEPGSIMVVFREQPGTVRVNGVDHPPAGPRVSIPNVEPGTHPLRIIWEGHPPLDTIIVVRSGRETAILILPRE